jgi:hypothetical protein
MPFVEDADMTEATIPVTIAEDAAARVAELGLQPEFDLMIERARQTLADLLHLRVTLEHDPDRPEDDPRIVIWAHKEEPTPEKLEDMTEWKEWVRWEYEHLPVRARLNIHLTTAYGSEAV